MKTEIKKKEQTMMCAEYLKFKDTNMKINNDRPTLNNIKIKSLNNQMVSKRENGITLIALVVTIVVLLILAGITIRLVFGSNGVIQKAQDSKEQTEIGEMREKLEMAKVPVYADGNGSYKVQDYWDRIESEGLIADKTVDIIDNGDGTYEVTTTPGYVFEITVEPNKEIAENIIIGECIGKGENLSIGIRVVKKTTNSIEIEVVRAEGASNFKYSIKKQGEEYGAAEEKSEKTHVFNGLTQGGIYTIKVEATKDGEQQIVEKTVQVGEIPLAIDGDVIWTGNGQAEVRIYTNETGYQLEWQKNGISEGSWTREASGVKEKTITGLVNGDIIYARLYDGTSSGKNANIEVRDDIVPTATIKLSGTAVEIGKPLTAEVVQTDNESGININQTKWVLNTEAGNIGTEASSYTGGTFTKTPETIILPTEIAGTYYLHVLTVDNAGNKKEVISGSVTITKKDVTVNWDKDKVDPVESADGETVPVPKGYVASNVASENTVKDGFVIYEGTDHVTESNVAEAQTSRNQFVWIPVANVHDMYGTDKDGKKWGKLYNFSASGITPLNWTEQDGVIAITNATSYREPEAVSTDFSNGITTSQLETEFNNMILSVEKYGGFYIGRYETGNLSEEKVSVIKNNSDIGNQTWYTIYNKVKGIAVNSNVTSSIIWGCQWDAVMKWMYNSGNSEKKIYTYNSIERRNDSSLIITGSNVKYAVNNIYDMSGNVSDWTIETYNNLKIFRGGYSEKFGSNGGGAASGRIKTETPNGSYVYCGARATLFIQT